MVVLFAASGPLSGQARLSVEDDSYSPRIASIDLPAATFAGEREAQAAWTAKFIRDELHAPAVVALQGAADEEWLTEVAAQAGSGKVAYRAFSLPPHTSVTTLGGASTVPIAGFLVDTGTVDVAAVQPWPENASVAAGSLLRFTLHAAPTAPAVSVLLLSDDGDLKPAYAAEASSELPLLVLRRDAAQTAVPEVRSNIAAAGMTELRDPVLRDPVLRSGASSTPQQRAFASAALLQLYRAARLPLLGSDGAPVGFAAEFLLQAPVRRMDATAAFNGDFGAQPLGIVSAVRTLSITATASNPGDVHFKPGYLDGADASDFQVMADTCVTLSPGSACTLTLTFTPSALGSRSATLHVPNDSANQPNFSLPLSGTGIAPFVVSAAGLNFGSVEVTTRTPAQAVQITNSSPLPAELGTLSISGDFAAQSNCPPVVAPGSSCSVAVAFQPQQSGPRPGALHFSGAARPNDLPLTGTGTDFGVRFAPGAGSTVAGVAVTANLAAQPMSGFSQGVVFSCSTDAPAGRCSLAAQVGLAATATLPVTLLTTPHYLVTGYAGLPGGLGWRSWLAWGTCVLVLLRMRRLARRAARLAAITAVVLLLCTGCGSRTPPENAAYTPPGTYNYTVTATDGVLTRTANFTLTVKAR